VFRNKITIYVKNRSAIPNKSIIIVINLKLRRLDCACLPPAI